MPTPDRPPGRILVIDDDRSARLLLTRVLEKAGHAVVVVDTAEQGLERLASGRFDVLVTDKNLPGIDGLEVVRRARQSNPQLRAVVMTGFPTPDAQTVAGGLGLFAYVTKPFGVQQILDVCEGALRAARAGE